MIDGLKIGLALGGGSARGIAHIGVLQVLEENHIDIDYIAGCSMGAVIGAIYACGVSTRFLQRIVGSLKDADIFDLILPMHGLLRGKRAQELILTLTGNRNFSDTLIPFCATAVDIETGRLIELREGPIHEAVRASISIPGAFRAVEKDGMVLVDGGVIERVPVNTARSMGADFVIAIDVGYHGEEIASVGTGISAVIMRSIEIMEWEILKHRVSTADVIIVPQLRHIQPTSLAQAEEAIQIGREETERELPRIRELLALAKQKRVAEKVKLAVNT